MPGYWENYRDLLHDYYWERKHAVLVCQICGQKLAPFITYIGSKSAGWVRVRGRYGGFICHQCYGHGMCMTHEGLDELKDMVKERNEETDRMILRYKMSHPWVRVKEY